MNKDYAHSMQDDTISRQAAIDALRVAYWDDNIQSAKDDPCIVDAMTDWAIRQVKALPSAQPEWESGEWEEIEVIADAYDISGVKTWASKMKCNQCGFTTIAIEGRFSQYNFCPNCGARMDEKRK